MNININLISLILTIAVWLVLFVTLWYNRELTKAAVALHTTSCDLEKLKEKKIRFSLTFKNTGKEACRIVKFKTGGIARDYKKLNMGTSAAEMVKQIIHTDEQFIHIVDYTLSKIDPRNPAGSFRDNYGNQVLTVTLIYQGTNFLSGPWYWPFSKRNLEQKYFLGYIAGNSKPHYLTTQEYKDVIKRLPDGFKKEQ